MFINKNLKYKILFLIFLLLPFPAFAYAGPGSAIGILIILITVILAFFSSVIFKIIALLKLIFNWLKIQLSTNKKIKKTKNKKK